MVAIPDAPLSRRSRLTVIHVARSDDEEELLELGAVAGNYLQRPRTRLAARTALRKQQGSLQPVWAIWPSLRPLGFELLTIDDEDACGQLDLFYEALAPDPLLARTRRSHVTIKPRGGWQGYGHPDVRARG